MRGLADAVERWHLADARQIADTPGSLVFRARRQGGGRVIAKLLKPRGMGELAGMDYLAWRQGRGAVRLLARDDNACLLEDAGGKTLEDIRRTDGEPAATAIFANLLRQLHAPSPLPVPAGLVPLDRHFSALLRQQVSIPAAAASNVAWAVDVARTLLAEQTDVMPLHGDLHHENVLADGHGRWRAIDPHGLLGDPCYDAANFFGNPLARPDVTCDSARIGLLARILAPALDCDENKILRFAAVHAALSACWSIDDPVSDEDLRDAGDRLAFLDVVRRLTG